MFDWMRHLQSDPCIGCETEEKLRLIIDTAPIGICVVDQEGNFIDTNKAYEEMLGYTKEELKGLSFYDITHPDYRPTNKKRFLSMFTLKPTSFKMDKVYIRKDGSAIDVAVHATAVDSNGSGMFGTAFVEDTTEQHRLTDELAVSEAKYRSITRELLEQSFLLIEAQRLAKVGSWSHGSPDKSWEKEPTPNVLAWSDETYRIFEVDPNYTGDLWEKFTEAVHPDDVEALSAAYLKALEDREPYTIQHRLLMPDGRIKQVIEWCETTYDEEGLPVKSIGTVQDITERYELREPTNRILTG